jgi:hypothetical protein
MVDIWEAVVLSEMGRIRTLAAESKDAKAIARASDVAAKIKKALDEMAEATVVSTRFHLRADICAALAAGVLEESTRKDFNNLARKYKRLARCAPADDASPGGKVPVKAATLTQGTASTER